MPLTCEFFPGSIVFRHSLLSLWGALRILGTIQGTERLQRCAQVSKEVRHG